MARPQPTIIIEHVESETYQAEQVLAADAVYAVFYEKRPVNLRSLNKLVGSPAPKYKKVNFSSPGHAINLAKRLNTQFRTTAFSVYRLVEGERIF